MSWWPFRRRVVRDRCVSPPLVAPAPRESLVTAALRSTAEDYVERYLQEGAEIIEATDGPVIDPFRQFIPGALAHRGLGLVSTARGWRVQRSIWPAPPPLGVECARCHASIFRCPHGAGVVWDATE